MRSSAGFLFAFFLVLSLVGCGNTGGSQGLPSNAASRPEITKAAAAPEPAPQVFDVDHVGMESTPDSSCFEEVGYDPDFQVLVVRFRDGGSLYTYSDFPEVAWEDFMAADSLGGWYNAHIKGEYEYEKIS